MFPFDFIDPFYFLIALCVGLLYTYVSTPSPEIVVKYPTPFNAGKITYVDDAGVCYRYKVNPTTCPSDPDKIKNMPISQS
jgi:hypothetical protein